MLEAQNDNPTNRRSCPMKKHTYKATKINEVDREWLADQVRDREVVVGADVAKVKQVVALMEREQERVVVTLQWEAPGQLREFVHLLCSLPARSIVVALEPTGTYGDALRWALAAAGITVYRVSPKRAHDAREIYDGVPSSHDAKAAAILAWLHVNGAGDLWPLAEEAQRDLRAAVATLARYGEAAQRLQNQLEAQLARHWPEVDSLLELDSAALLALLARVGGPAAVAQKPAQARQVLRKAGGVLLSPAKVEAVLATAATTVGCPLSAGESAALQDLAAELQRVLACERRAKREVERQAQAAPGIAAMGAVVGLTTAAVLFCEVGDPRRYPRAKAYEKAAGLNLKERSSGKHQGQLKITKRGPGKARQWLYLAVWRLIQRQPTFAAWYERKVVREGGQRKNKALVALMRKLIRALWHVGQGEAFDPGKLFDLRRLGLAA